MTVVRGDRTLGLNGRLRGLCGKRLIGTTNGDATTGGRTIGAGRPTNVGAGALGAVCTTADPPPLRNPRCAWRLTDMTGSKRTVASTMVPSRCDISCAPFDAIIPLLHG